MTTPMTKADGAHTEDGAGRIAVIAGSGRLPAAVLATLSLQGQAPLGVLIEGEADHAAAVAGVESERFRLEDAGLLVGLLKRHGVDKVVLAGGVSRRPALKSFRWNFGLLRMLPRTVVALASGDDALLKAVIAHLADNGIDTVGAHEVVPDLLAPEGALTSKQPSERDRRDMAAGIAAARAIGALDIGQAAVAIGGRVVALEGVEGTDGLLERVRDLRGNGRIAAQSGGVLVKCAKPGQELRADLPAIGPATVEAVEAAGLCGIAVEAGRTFVLDHDETVRLSDAAGLFVFGFAAEAG